MRSIYPFLRLNRAYTKLGLLHISNSYLANLTKTIVLSYKRFDITLSVLSVFWRNFWTIAFETNHSSWNANYLILICLTLLGILLLLILSLISHSSDHHISRLIGILLLRLWHHNNIIFFYDSDSLFLSLWILILLLCLNYVTAKHLLILNIIVILN